MYVYASSNCSFCLCIHKLLLPMISSRAIEMSTTLRFLDVLRTRSNGRNRLFSSLADYSKGVNSLGRNSKVRLLYRAEKTG